MTVAIQNGLENLASSLRDYGFDVVKYGQYNYPIDALIYSGTHMPYTSSVSSGENTGGVFMVNAYGKSPSEIVQILQRRTYTPLF